MITQRIHNDVTILTLENECLRVELAPALGGRFTSVYNRQLNREFLWHNQALELQKQERGADYDSNFWGGIDELLPNDIPETVDGITYPDHGELWTTALDYVVEKQQVILSGILPLSGLFYQKAISLVENTAQIKTAYTIRNLSGSTRRFLWKLHAALQITAGDRLDTAAATGRIVYPESSRLSTTEGFDWPHVAGMDAAVVPVQNNTMDFFYLYNAPEGMMSMRSAVGAGCFTYRYDQAVFPYQWYFASYGKFRNHYTAILEPATAMPVSVNDAAAMGQCSVLQPGEAIDTVVTIYAGKVE